MTDMLSLFIFLSPHAKLCAVIELEVNLVHELSNKEYASAVRDQQILRCNWVRKPAWIEPGTRILDAHEQIAVLVHGDEDVYRFLRIAVVTVNHGVGEGLSYREPDDVGVAPMSSAA